MNILETIEARFGELKTLLASKQGLEEKISALQGALDAVNKAHTETSAKLEEAQAKLKAGNDSAAALAARVTELEKLNADQASTITKLQDEAKNASQKASEMLASQGIASDRIPATTQQGTGEAATQALLAQYHKMSQDAALDKSGQAAMAAAKFYQDNKEALQKAMRAS